MKRVIAWRAGRLPLIAVAVLAGIVIGVGGDRVAFARQAGITRTILLRADDPANRAYEAVVAVAELPPGASAGKHRHDGIELGYVLQGSILLERAGQRPVLARRGEAFRNVAGVHDAMNPGKTPTKILAVYIVKKGEPISTPVP
jgi:quercetin dioxygenase-like cupin family protein